MHIEALTIVGAGGHCKVVLDALASNQMPLPLVHVVDRDQGKVGSKILGHLVSGWRDPRMVKDVYFHVAIGDGLARRSIGETMLAAGKHFVTICHPRSCLARSAFIGDGAFIGALAVVAPDSKVGTATIVNHGAIVDHDCVIGAYSHVAPNAILGGGANVGNMVLVGAGATILPGVRVADCAIIGAGAVVAKNVGAGEVVAGVPAVRILSDV